MAPGDVAQLELFATGRESILIPRLEEHDQRILPTLLSVEALARQVQLFEQSHGVSSSNPHYTNADIHMRGDECGGECQGEGGCGKGGARTAREDDAAEGGIGTAEGGDAEVNDVWRGVFCATAKSPCVERL